MNKLNSDMDFFEITDQEYHRIKTGYDRYEKVSILNVQQFADLFERALTSKKSFDELVDDLAKVKIDDDYESLNNLPF